MKDIHISDVEWSDLEQMYMFAVSSMPNALLSILYTIIQHSVIAKVHMFPNDDAHYVLFYNAYGEELCSTKTAIEERIKSYGWPLIYDGDE